MKGKFFAMALFVSLELISNPFFVSAQVPGVPRDPNNTHGGTDNGNGNNGINNGQNTDAPFDIGLGILVAAGAVIGVKKAYDKRKKIKSVNV